MGEIKSTAYLREFDKANQCELRFALKVELENVSLLHEEVQAVRQVTDTVESLLQHIINKLEKSIKTIRENNDHSDDYEVNIPVALKNGLTQTPITGTMVLKDLIKSNMKGLEFQIFNQHYDVIINAPLCKEIKLPDVVYANFTIQASKLYCLFTDNSICEYSWYRSKDKENWTKIGNTNKYGVKEDDIDHYLKLECVPCNSELRGPPAEAISENKVDVINNIPTCPFEERHKFTTTKLNGRNFRMVSYNVLSSRYTDSKKIPYCSPKFLAIDYRKQLISKELLGYKTDIICLQEVDSSVYSTYYKGVFKDEGGYMSYYHRKGNRISEGLACFFNTSRFKKEDDHQIIYSNQIKHNLFTYLRDFVQANPEVNNVFMEQMTSLHVTVLKMRLSKKSHIIIVGNTHLFYHPDHELIRALQINMATTHLWFLAMQYSQKNSVKVVLCGDFNSVPTSAVIEYLTQGKLKGNHSIFQKTKNNPELFHKFQFESACGVPKYTNYTKDFKNCLDYIFIEKNKMKANKIIPFPKEKELATFEGLPSEVYPSDHLALVVDLEIIV